MTIGLDTFSTVDNRLRIYHRHRFSSTFFVLTVRGLVWEDVLFSEFTSAVQLDLYKLSHHTTLYAQREDGLRNRRCVEA